MTYLDEAIQLAREDPAFRERLRRSIEENKELLDRLATPDGPASPVLGDEERERLEAIRETERRVVAAAELLVGAAAGHPSRPSARRSYWASLETELGALHVSEHLDELAQGEKR